MVGQPTTIDDRYRLVRLLEDDAATCTWRAVDERLRRDVVVTIVAAGDPAVLGLIARTANPGLVTVLDAGDTPDGAYVVTEAIAWPTVQELRAGGPLAPRDVATIGASVATTLAYLHEAGLTHGVVRDTTVHAALPAAADDPPPRIATRLADFAMPRLLGAPPSDPADDIRDLGRLLLDALGDQPVDDSGSSVLAAMTDAAPEQRPRAVEAAAALAAWGMACADEPVAAPARRRSGPRHARPRRTGWGRRVRT
jgi:eukaryotic-like serine/threonine-protein kinase